MSELPSSYVYCQRLARNAASNFYYCFWLLPRAKRRAMYALYAFLRHVDDVADDPRPSPHATADQPSDGELLDLRLKALADLRRAIEQAIAGRPEGPLLPALADTVRTYHVPVEYLHRVIDGMEMDLRGRRYTTFAELKEYCHCVAGVVGQACIHIWGFRDPQAIDLAAKCGLAFQLTNVLRDLREDVRAGRVYLPQEDLDRFGYRAEDLAAGVVDQRFQRLLEFEIDRAEQYYREAEYLPQHLHADGRRIFVAMFRTYRGLLHRVQQSQGNVSGPRARLSLWAKLRIATSSVLRPVLQPTTACSREATLS